MGLIERIFGKSKPVELQDLGFSAEQLREIQFKQLAVKALREAERAGKDVEIVSFSIPAELDVTRTDILHAAEAIHEWCFCLDSDLRKAARARNSYCGLIYRNPLGPTILEIAFSPEVRNHRLVGVVETVRRNYQIVDLGLN